MKTRQDFNNEMQKLSNRLGHWPKIKKSALAILEKDPNQRSEKELSIIKKYEKLKPIREKVKELKAERDKLFPQQVKKAATKYLKVIRDKGESLIFEIGSEQIEINKMFIEQYRRVIYQIPEDKTELIKKHGIDRTGQDLNAKAFYSGGFKQEIQSSTWAKRR